MKKIAPALICLLTLNSLLLHLTAKGQMETGALDALVEKAMKTFNVAGVAVAIVKDGKVIHEKGYGLRSIDSKQPVDEHTNFQIASNSKAFTTAALAMLVEEGKLSWKDKVKTYLPEFKMYNDYVTENFLIEDLLTHRSGLGLGVGDLMSFPDGANFTIHDVLTNFQYFTPVSAFRTRFDYDNQLYIVAGEVIARVGGMSWEKFVQSRIMDPLRMSHSYTSFAAMNERTNIAMPHSTETGKIRTISLFQDQVNGAAGGIFSNVDDMAKWMLVHLNKGKFGQNLTQQLFTEKSQREMWRIHTVLESSTDPRYNQHFNGYGLGWNLSDMKGNLRVAHTGGLPGMLTAVTMIPDLNLGIVVLTNTENGGSPLFLAINQAIMDSYLGLSPIDWIERYAHSFSAQQDKGDSISQKVWETVAAAKGGSIKKEDFTGLYQDKWFGKIEIFVKGKKLWFRSLRSPKLNGPMEFYKATTFAIKWEYQDMNADAFATFNFDEEGRANSIKMKGISPNIDFSFDFQDLDLQRVNR